MVTKPTYFSLLREANTWSVFSKF